MRPGARSSGFQTGEKQNLPRARRPGRPPRSSFALLSLRSSSGRLRARFLSHPRPKPVSVPLRSHGRPAPTSLSGHAHRRDCLPGSLRAPIPPASRLWDIDALRSLPTTPATPAASHPQPAAVAAPFRGARSGSHRDAGANLQRIPAHGRCASGSPCVCPSDSRVSRKRQTQDTQRPTPPPSPRAVIPLDITAPPRCLRLPPLSVPACSGRPRARWTRAGLYGRCARSGLGPTLAVLGSAWADRSEGRLAPSPQLALGPPLRPKTA